MCHHGDAQGGTRVISDNTRGYQGVSGPLAQGVSGCLSLELSGGNLVDYPAGGLANLVVDTGLLVHGAPEAGAGDPHQGPPGVDGVSRAHN